MHSSALLPLVSIVIPVYNGSNFLSQAIDSALKQTYKNVEIIVVNDGSIDDGATRKIALSYKDKIRYYEKENGGVSSALNYGIKQMKGEYFAWLSHDDMHLPEKVEKQMNAVLKYKGDKPVICVCNYFLVDEEGTEFARSPHGIEKYFRKSANCFFGAETNLMIDGDATLISRSLFDKCGFFDETLFASQETDMWYRSKDIAEFIFIPDYLVAYRYHSQQVTHKRAAAVGMEAGAYRGALIEKLTLPELRDYFSTEKDAARFGVSAYSYMYLFFYEASHQLIKKLRQLCFENWNLVYDVLASMFAHGDASTILSMLKKENSFNSKRKILVYYDDWAGGDLSDRLAKFANHCSESFEFILVSCGEERSIVPDNISYIYFSLNAQSSLAIYLALLAELLNVDIFWNNAAYFIPNTISMSYLKNSSIHCIASFHYYEPAVNLFISGIDDDWQSTISDTSFITHENDEKMLTQYLYPFDSLLLPPLEAYDQWVYFFKGVLAAENLNDKFIFVEAVSNTLLPQGVIDNIQKCLEKYEEGVLEKHKQYYEQSLYWKITKPLRIVSDILKRIYRKLFRK